jgi:hypothetical protein
VKRSFRVLSITVVLGLLAAAFGMGNVLAKQAGVSDLGQPDLVAPLAVTIAEDDVQFTTSAGVDVSFVKPGVVATFFVTDGALESKKSGTAVVGSGPAGLVGNDTLNLGTGNITLANGTVLASTTSSYTYSLTAPDLDTTTPANTPLASVAVAGNFAVVGGTDGTVVLFLQSTSGATTTATFDHHIRDSWTGSDTALRRALVTSTSDPQGEYVTIRETSATDGITAVVGGTATIADNGLSATVPNVPLVDTDADGDVDYDDITITVSTGAVATGTVSAVNLNTGVVTFSSVQSTSSAPTASYSHATASPTSQLFRGDILITDDAAFIGPGDDSVWAQNGDTLTIAYLDSAGAILDSDTITVDAQEPSVTSIVPADGAITNVTNPTVTFTVVDEGSAIKSTAPGTVIKLFINDEPASPAPQFLTRTNGFDVVFSTQASWITAFGVTDSTKFSLKITATDVAGNKKIVSGTDLELTIDETLPVFNSASTGTATTNITATFSEALDETTVSAAQFTVDGVAPSAAAVDADHATNFKVNLTVAALDAAARPDVIVLVGGIKDKAANAVAATTVKALDGILPSLSAVTISHGLAIKDDAVTVTLDSDEKLTTGGATVSIIGPAASVFSSALVLTSPQPQKNVAAVTVTTLTTTGKYGASIQIVDIAQHIANNLTAVTAEVATITAGVAQVAKTPIGDANFDGVLDEKDVTITIGGVATGTVAIDASAGTIDVGGASIAAGAAVLVTYSYVGTDTFEVDQSAPTLAFEPDGSADVQDQSPFVRIIFDDDEYPGDSFKTVTLTTATLTNPDLTTQDLLANFVTTDSIEYLWAASGLALGTYKLEAKGADTAGNEGTSSVTFKIVERQPISIALRPGWNLISLPGAPAAAAQSVDEVISNIDVDVVLTYDSRSASGFQSAVRGPDDTFGTDQALKTIDGSRAFWIHTTTFAPLLVDIPGIQAGTAVLPPSFSLASGWNLIPVATLDTGTTVRGSTDYFSGLLWSRAYGYDNATNSFDSILPTTSEDLKVGQGYWIFLRESGELVP